MIDTKTLTIEEAREGLRSKKFSCTELVDACLKSVEQHKDLNACITVTDTLAARQAAAVDEKIARGEKIGILEGIPYTLKDVYCTKGIRTTAASKILENYIPPYNATAYERLEDAGAVLIAKTNTDEFTMGASNEHSAFGPVKNPYDTTRVSGGSSGGPVVATQTGMGLFAMGTDTGGSIRQPAAFTGVVGFKPTYGRISRFGTIPMASSLDTLGPIAKTVRDVAHVMEVVAGDDPKDATCSQEAVPKYTETLDKGIAGMKIGVPKEFFVEGMEPGVEKAIHDAINTLASLGAEIVDVSLPHTKYALPTYYIIAPAEVSSNLARYDGVRFGHGTKEKVDSLIAYYMKTRDEALGDEVKRRIMIGTYVLSSGYYDAYYAQAQKVRTLVCRDFEDVFKKVDVVVGATSPTVAFKIGEKVDDQIAMYLVDVLTVSANVAGIPGISVPCGTVPVQTSGARLPVGLQILGPQFGEEVVLRMAHAYEEVRE